MKCRLCGATADQVFVDLGHQPPSNAYLTREQLALPEVTFPLRVFVCNACWLVQLPEHAASHELFTDDYAYFSSVSSTWVEHARRYVQSISERFNLGRESFFVEIASNDGYLLQFVKQRGIRCLGIEPTASTANAAREKGIETVEGFFGREFATKLVSERGPANLLAANNVLAHVPDLNDFVAGIAIALADDGIATLEFPHLMRLVRGRQFDTIYHEHYSYLAFHPVNRLFASHGLRVFDVEELPTHGGSLRVFATPIPNTKLVTTHRVDELMRREVNEGMQTVEYYADFQPQVDAIKNDLLTFLLQVKREGKKICGYGAAAKGNTLLNYAGVRSDLLPFVCDAAPSKQNKYLPGCHIPIVSTEHLRSACLDHVLILPWNIAAEVVQENSHRVSGQCRFVTAVPQLCELS